MDRCLILRHEATAAVVQGKAVLPIDLSGMRLSLQLSTTVATLLVSQSVGARAQSGVGSIAGVVRDSMGQGLSFAKILILGARPDRGFESDSGGNYRIPSIGAGRLQLLARRIGYSAETLSVVVLSDATVRADFVMSPTPDILPMVVVEDRTRGKMGAFNQRMARGVGSFVTRAEIEKRQPASISELLRTLPGVHISQRMAGEPQPIDMQRSRSSSMQSNCVVQLYVDGQPYPNGNIDDFPPLSLEGVEVYRSASEIPADFRTRNATCGLISLWTRDPEAAHRRP